MPRCSPLDAEHRALAAKMVPFGGWDMPLSYGDGTIAEHLACRRHTAAFDVSHLGTVRLEGPSAKAALQAAFTNDLDRIAPGRAQYTHLLDDTDASVIDDIIVWWVGPERFDVMPNASNTDPIHEAIGGEDVTSTRAVIAVQGPEARRRMAEVVPEVADVARFGVGLVSWRGIECVVAGTGYTGEEGVEFAVPADAARDFWRAVLAAGVTPAGLGARDTLRLEAGLPLHGHELGPGITPLQAGLGWVVAWNKESFLGRSALQAERDRGVARVLRGLRLSSRRPPRAGQKVSHDGAGVGEVTSGNYSPLLEVGIGLALMSPDVAPGMTVDVDVRGTPERAEVVKPPFVGPRAAPSASSPTV